MTDILNMLIEFKTLDRKMAARVLNDLAEGKYSESQMAAFLTVYMMRNITLEELQGFRDAMMDLCIPVQLDEYNAIDLCGTGGDGKNTFNISTMASFIVAGAGINVAKHGNNGVSSVCGSSNLLNYFGYSFTNDLDSIRKSIEEAGICFLHAPLFHPAMKNVAGVRKSLGVKTFFNMLGPMVNPSSPKNQLVGVFSLELARLYGYLYQNTDKHFAIVHSLDKYDEISLTGPFKVISNRGEKLYNPEDLGFKQITEQELYGGETIEEAAAIFENILNGNGTLAQNNTVIANAGFAIHVASGGKEDLLSSIERAKESLLSGKAKNVFTKLINL